MQGDVVLAAKWLGGSIVLASALLTVGLRWQGMPEHGRSTRTASAFPGATVVPGVMEPVDPSTDAVVEPDAQPAAALLPTLAVPPAANALTAAIPEERANHVCPNPPTEDEVWSRVSKSKGDGASPSTAKRSTAVFLIEKVGEHIDPGKTYPAGGPVRLVHCHYKCTVGFDETSPSEYPLPGRKVDHRVEVVYLDKDHLRRVSTPAVATHRR